MAHAEPVVRRFVCVVFLLQYFRIVLFIVERACVVGVAAPAQPCGAELPRVLHTGGCRQPLVVVHRIAWVCLGVEIVHTEVHYKAAKLHSLACIQQLAVGVGLEARLERCGFQLAPDEHHATCHIAVLHRGYASYHFHALYVVGRYAPHVHAACGVVSACIRVAGTAARCLLHCLHIGIAVHRDAVGHEHCSHGTDVVVAASASCLPQFYTVGVGQVGQLCRSARQQREKVGEARRLQMFYCLAVDDRRCGDALRLVCRHHHLIQHMVVLLQPQRKGCGFPVPAGVCLCQCVVAQV